MRMEEVVTIDLDWMNEHHMNWDGKSYFIWDDKGLNLEINETHLRSPYYLFLIWLDGGGTVTSNHVEYHICKNDGFIFLPNMVYKRVLLPGSVRKGIIIAPEYLEKINFSVKFGENMAMIFRHLRLSLNKKELQAILCLFDFLDYITSNREHKVYQDEIEENAFFALFFEIFSLYKRHLDNDFLGKSPRSLELWTRFVGLLAANFRKKRTVEFYANQLYVTPNYFSETIKSLRGKTAGQVIIDMVISEAKALLKNPGLSVRDIADDLNFADQATFTKYFKHYTGQTPTQFRRAILKV